MPVLPKIADYADELTEIRRDFHQHPEIGFEEVRTSGIVAELLKKWGVDEIHTGLGKTGVIGVIKGKKEGGRTVGVAPTWTHCPWMR